MSAPDVPPPAEQVNLFTDPKSWLAPSFLRAWQLAAVVILAGVFLVLNFLPLWHTDVWAHMKFGEWMVTHRQCPEHEPFCDLADHESPYIAFGWLSQIGFHLTFRAGQLLAGGDALHQLAGGVEMLRGLHALLLALRWGLLLVALYRLTYSLPLACLGTLLSMLLMGANFGVIRPQVTVEPLFPLLLLFLSRPTLSARATLLTPLVMILWANLHGSYFVGLALLTGALGGRVIQLGRSVASALVAGPPDHQGPGYHGAVALAVREIVNDSQCRRLFLALVLSTLGVALLNPHGPRLFIHTVALAYHPNIADMDEWKSMNWAGGRGVLFLLSVGLIGLTLAFRLRSKPRPDSFPTDLLLLLSFGVQTVLHQRVMAWWAMLVPWVLVPHWLALARGIPWLVTDTSTPSFRKSVIAAAVVFLSLRFAGPVQLLVEGELRPLEKSLSAGTPWRLAAQLSGQVNDYPALADWLKSQPGGHFHGRIYCTETQGDYLVWALPPELPIFMYTHVHLFPPEVWKECLRIKRGDADWERLLDCRGVNLIIFEPDLFPRLRNNLVDAKQRWLVLLNESGDPAKGKETRLMIAVRKKPPVTGSE